MHHFLGLFVVVVKFIFLVTSTFNSTWHSNSRPQDQEVHGLPTEPGRGRLLNWKKRVLQAEPEKGLIHNSIIS